MSQVLLCQGTALHLPLKDASVHCCVTSPPYWGLRSYGIGEGELGLEPTLEAYVEAMAQVFREVKRVLRPDGTLWCNVGDVYTSGNRDSYGPLTGKNVAVKIAPRPAQPVQLKEKNLLGLPWRLALALQADGWILRSEIIWHKLNPMPESVQDRPTRSHEQVFLFSKQPQYFYDAVAVREPGSINTHLRFVGGATPRKNGTKWAESHGGSRPNTGMMDQVDGRNLRTVWSLPSEATPYAHFATFPSALVRRCLLAGAPSQVCGQCGAPWKREVERGPLIDQRSNPGQPAHLIPQGYLRNGKSRCGVNESVHLADWQPTCACQHASMPATVLDPFCGSGTTLLVARELGHHAIGTDLSYSYLHDIARTRLGLTALDAWTHGQRPQPVRYDDLPLFAL